MFLCHNLILQSYIKKHKKVCATLIHTEHIVLACTITGCIGVLIGIMSSAIRLTICAIAARIKKYKSIIKKKKKEHDKMALPAKSKLNSTEVLSQKSEDFIID